MARVKTIIINEVVGRKTLNVNIKVNAVGMFYANFDVEYAPALKDVFEQKNIIIINKIIKVHADTMSELTTKIHAALALHYKPEVKEEYVILYNIKSQISFVEDDEGNIFPNGTYCRDKYENMLAKWSNGDKYGNSHATNPVKDGYSLLIGAEACKKTTRTFGDSSVVTYDRHHGEAAEKLNSWCSLKLDRKNCKQIPYTDEAAEFFFDLLMGMAKLSKMVQENTFDQKNMLDLIASKQKLLGDVSDV